MVDAYLFNLAGGTSLEQSAMGPPDFNSAVAAYSQGEPGFTGAAGSVFQEAQTGANQSISPGMGANPAQPPTGDTAASALGGWLLRGVFILLGSIVLIAGINALAKQGENSSLVSALKGK